MYSKLKYKDTGRNDLDGLEVMPENDKELVNETESIEEWVEELYWWELENAINLKFPLSSLDYYFFPENKSELKALCICEYFNSIPMPKSLKNSIPREIVEFINLRQLIAVGDIEIIPEEIGKLINLLHVEINSCYELESLPKEILNLKYLTHLNISNTRITKLPKEIGNFPHLLELTLYRNEITELSDEIINLKSLRILNIDLNPNLVFTKKQKKWLNELEEQGCDVSINAYLEDSPSKETKIILDTVEFFL